MLRRVAPVLAVFALSLAGTPVNGFAQQEELTETLAEIEQSLWEGWASHDAEPFRTHVAENFVNVNPGGIWAGKNAAIQSVENHGCDVASLSFSDWTVHRVSDGVAILTYRATQDVTCNGEKLPSKMVAAATYVRKGGQWLNVSLSETPSTSE